MHTLPDAHMLSGFRTPCSELKCCFRTLLKFKWLSEFIIYVAFDAFRNKILHEELSVCRWKDGFNLFVVPNPTRNIINFVPNTVTLQIDHRRRGLSAKIVRLRLRWRAIPAYIPWPPHQFRNKPLILWPCGFPTDYRLSGVIIQLILNSVIGKRTMWEGGPINEVTCLNKLSATVRI